MSLRRVLIANRGEIALRIARTARRMGIETVAIHSDPDARAPHVSACDAAISIGGAAPRDSYLDIGKILSATQAAGADAIHPGYGFLAESAAFARAVESAGIVFVGPTSASIAAMGDKALARARMAAVGLPVLPGYEGEAQDDAAFAAAAARIGFPVMIKAAAGGGGRGMRRVVSASELPAALAAARSEASGAFGDSRLILERALVDPRHVEVQILADSSGRVVTLGERDCSIQRRHQKIVEEAPAPGIDASVRRRLTEAAVAVARDVAYVGAGTVEFLFDGRDIYFMEMNTRLQVEHPVTEAVTGLDLVEWQFRVARGERLPWERDDVAPSGHAIEVRLCAEDPTRDFLPGTGRIEAWRAPAGVRVDHAIVPALELSPYYDSMLAKVVAHGATRDEARCRLSEALRETVLFGVPTNRAFLTRVLDHPAFAGGEVSTGFIGRHFPDGPSRAPAPDDRTWALAAWLSVRPPGDLPPAWQGFDTTGAARVPVRLAWGGATRSGYVAEARGASARVELEPGAVLAVDGAGAHPWHRADSRLYLQTRLGEWAFDDRRFEGRSAAGAGPRDGRLVAPMNGRVAFVGVEVGARVERGDVLVTLEAMKMEHAVAAPCAGTVAGVHVRADDQVAPGRLLVEIAPDARGEAA